MAGVNNPSGSGQVGPWRALVALWFLGPNAQIILRLHTRGLLPLLLFGVVGAFVAEFVVPPMESGVGLVWAGASAVMFARLLRMVLMPEACEAGGQEYSGLMAIAINAPLFAEFVRILGGGEPLVLVIFVLNVCFACGLVLRPSAGKVEGAAPGAVGNARNHRAAQPPGLVLLGPVIGRLGSRPIYAWVEDNDGQRLSFDCVAPPPQQPGAQRYYEALCRDASSWVAVEGAIYRVADGAGPAKSGPPD